MDILWIIALVVLALSLVAGALAFVSVIVLWLAGLIMAAVSAVWHTLTHHRD